MLRLSDFGTCTERYHNQSGGSISQLWNMKFRRYLHLTLVTKFFMLAQLTDFVVCSTSLEIWSSGIYI